MEQHSAKFTLLKRVAIGLLISLIMLVTCVVLAVIALNHLGIFENWIRWRGDNYLMLLAWRVFLYAVVIVGWLKVRDRLPMDQSDATSNRRRRVEGLVVLLFLIIEIAKAPIAWLEVV
jgi:hypothetical protein